MEQTTAAAPLQLCLRGPDCPDHADDPRWLHPAPRRRPAYPAANRRLVA